MKNPVHEETLKNSLYKEAMKNSCFSNRPILDWELIKETMVPMEVEEVNISEEVPDESEIRLAASRKPIPIRTIERNSSDNGNVNTVELEVLLSFPK